MTRRNAPLELKKETVEKSLKDLKTVFTQFDNGYTITATDYRSAVQALRELKRLPLLIEYYVGVEDEDI